MKELRQDIRQDERAEARATGKVEHRRSIATSMDKAEHKEDAETTH